MGVTIYCRLKAPLGNDWERAGEIVTQLRRPRCCRTARRVDAVLTLCWDLRKSRLLAALWAASALLASVTGAVAQYDHIITPDQFQFQAWGGNLNFSTVGAYAGDNSTGYGWTANYGASPSATVIIPLPAGLPAGAHMYNIYEWIPSANSAGQYHVIDIAADGTLNNNPNHDPATGIPWVGQFGTDHQYLTSNQDLHPNAGSWVELGPGPQSDPTLGGGLNVWINPSTGLGAPYLQIRYSGFENIAESFDAIRVVEVLVPEPSALALSLVGGLALLAGFSRRARH
jgi:hypothetical protein